MQQLACTAMVLHTSSSLITDYCVIVAAVLIDARRRQTYDLRLVHLLNVEVRIPGHAQHVWWMGCAFCCAASQAAVLH